MGNQIGYWVLVDSLNAHIIDFDVYIGKVAGQEVSANGLGQDVIMKLMGPSFNADNFYMLVTLFKDQFERGAGATVL